MSFLAKLKGVFFTQEPVSTSEKGTLNAVDLAKVTRTGLLMGLATSVTYLLSNLQPEMFGEHSGVAAIVLTILSELSLRFLKDNK